MHFVLVYSDRAFEMNCSVWRVFEPAKALAAIQGISVAVMDTDHYADLNNREVRAECQRADLIHIQRNIIMPEVWNATRYYLGMGKCVTLDLDDAYDKLPPSNPAHEFWIKNASGLRPEPLEALRIAMSNVDALTSPSRLILEDWQETAKQGLWWPNWATGAWYAGVKREPHEGCVIGWGGSSSL